VGEECEEIWMTDFDASSQSRVIAFDDVVCANCVVTNTESTWSDGCLLYPLSVDVASQLQ